MKYTRWYYQKMGSTWSKNSTLFQIGIKYSWKTLEIEKLFAIIDLLNLIHLVKKSFEELSEKLGSICRKFDNFYVGYNFQALFKTTVLFLRGASLSFFFLLVQNGFPTSLWHVINCIWPDFSLFVFPSK